MGDGIGDERAQPIIQRGRTPQLVLVLTNEPNLPDGLGAKPHAVIIAEVGNGELDLLVRVLLLHFLQGQDLFIEGGHGTLVAVLHAAGSVEENVLQVDLLHGVEGLR